MPQWNAGPLSVYAAYVGLYTDFGNSTTGAGGGYDYGFLAQAGYMLNNDWEVFGRYDYTHLDNQISGDEDSFHEVSVGVNYYLHGQNAKISVDAGWLPNGASVEPDRDRCAGEQRRQRVLHPRSVPARAVTPADGSIRTT